MNQQRVRLIKENMCVRVFAFPFEQVRRRARLAKYQRSEDTRYIRSLKGTHAGERCFIIGNGPSLIPKDLDVLHKHGVFSFAANRIYGIYPRTIWRPSIYMALDTFFIADGIGDIKAAGSYPKIINYNSRKFGRRPEDNIHYLCVHESFKVNPFQISVNSLSEDPSIYSVKTGTVTATSIEMAVYMGFSDIYLLGVDNNFANKRRADGTVYIDSRVKASHFPGGEPGKSLGPSIQSVEYMERTYEVAKRFSDEHGVSVRNATRGGKLEIFERVGFDDIFCNERTGI